MTIRPQFKTYRVPVVPQAPEPPPQIFEADNLLGGLIADANPTIIPDNSLQLLINGVYIKTQLFRRNGLQLYSLAKPDTVSVLAIQVYKDITYGIQFLRFTRSSINRASSVGWSAATGPALNGSDLDRYSFTVADSRLFFSNNGANVISEYLPASNTYVALGDAPKYRYITSAFNRLIGASLVAGTSKPFQIGWSGDLNYAEWDPTVDISAGSTPLVNSPADLSDDITGLFNLTSILCITRQRSIWLATNLPSATNPFNFFVDLPRVGADTPATIQIVDKGLVFYCYQKSTLYQYIPGYGEQGLVNLSQAVKRQLKSDIVSANYLFSSYDADANTYSLFIYSSTSSLVKCYQYSFEVEAWVYSEFYNVISCSTLEYNSSDISINGLSGTINSLLGSIDELGGLSSNSNRLFGLTTGDILVQPTFDGTTKTAANLVNTDNGYPIFTTYRFKTFVVKGKESVYNTLAITYTPYTVGSIAIGYSKNTNNTLIIAKTVYIESDMLGKAQYILIKRPIRAKQLVVQIASDDCLFSLDNYRMEADVEGDAVTTDYISNS